VLLQTTRLFTTIRFFLAEDNEQNPVTGYWAGKGGGED
jgi:hypothetical protein